jgi:hypothetical protein
MDFAGSQKAMHCPLTLPWRIAHNYHTRKNHNLCGARVHISVLCYLYLLLPLFFHFHFMIFLKSAKKPVYEIKLYPKESINRSLPSKPVNPVR